MSEFKDALFTAEYLLLETEWLSLEIKSLMLCLNRNVTFDFSRITKHSNDVYSTVNKIQTLLKEQERK